MEREKNLTSKIMLIRHGITEGNKKKWYYGTTDLPLEQEGIEALEEMAKAGKYSGEEHWKYYTSGMKRTEQTFEILFGNRKRDWMPLLREMKFGIFECKSYEDLKDDADFQRWCDEKDVDFAPEGGESKRQFWERIQAGIKDLLMAHRDNEAKIADQMLDKDPVTVVVCHGGVISSILMQLFPEEKKTIWDLIPKPGYGYELILEDGQVKKYNPL